MKYYAIALICASLVSLPLVAQKGNGAMDQIRIVAVNATPEPDLLSKLPYTIITMLTAVPSSSEMW